MFCDPKFRLLATENKLRYGRIDYAIAMPFESEKSSIKLQIHENSLLILIHSILYSRK